MKVEPRPVRPITEREVSAAALSLPEGHDLNVGPVDTPGAVNAVRRTVQRVNQRAGRKILRSYRWEGNIWVGRCDV